jgi:phosphomannomutase/phosphoglucomutase
MMDINPYMFRGYDLRGVVDVDLSYDVMKRIARGYATMMAQRRVRHAVVGAGSRATGEEYKKAVIEGLVESGMHVVDIGLSLSQTMYWAQYHYLTNGGINITASHNPANYNGMKIAMGYSNTMVTDEIQELRDIVIKGDYIAGDGSCRTATDWHEGYKNDLLKRVHIAKRFKVVIDTAHSTPGVFMPDILRSAGCEVIEQNCDLDSSFPDGVPDPTEESFLARLSRRVLAEHADLGLAYDEDGDRIGVVDDQGTMIWNDVIVALLAKDVIASLPGAKIVYNTLCSRLVTDVIEQAGGTPIMWLTGHSFIKAKIREERAPFGGELSGHFFFTDNFYGHDDGAFTSLRLLEFLSHADNPLSRILAELPQYISSPEIKLKCADDIKWDVIKRLTAKMKEQYPHDRFTTIDGVRVDFPDGMHIIRASQNGPYITVKFEAQTKERYGEIRQRLLADVRSDTAISFDDGVNVEAFTEGS